MKSLYSKTLLSLPIITILMMATILASTYVSADDNSTVDQISITVPMSCTMSGTGMDSHNTNINNGTYTPDIGTTTMHVFCNDNEGFAIYAAGYTGDEIGGENSNKLVGTNASGNSTIESGLATTTGNPDISNWAMKLAITQDSGDISETNAFVIDSAPNVDLPSQAEQSTTSASFSSYHVVPNEYVKVAHKTAATDMTNTTGGVKLTTTYAAYISKTQAADTYSGQVIYTLVHPSSHDAPIANPAMLDTGKVVNSKLKSLAATIVNGEETTITPEFDPGGDYDWGDARDEYIKSISVHLKTSAPVDFTPSEMNTISSTASKKPIYIVFDNTNDAGIMHFYTEGEKIFLPSDSSFMFYMFNNLSEISGISDWDTSNATNMSYMFYNAGSSATTFTLALSSWNTSNVTDMSYMFMNAGSSATTWSIGDLSSWNTSNVTNMSYMFFNAGYSATTWSIGDLSSWNTSNVTDMRRMFYYAGYSVTTWSIGDLSSWNTSNVTDMSYMFNSAGNSATTWSVGNLSSWNTSSVTDMSYMFSGAGHSATTWSIGDISSWNTSNVTNMSDMFFSAGYSATTFTLNLSSWNTSSVISMNRMFYYAGYSAITWSVIIPQTNGNSINNTTSRLYGQTTSKYAAPPSGKSFTIAQP
ncbi:DUF285 domain-containing protein [Candidatus Saccharibacteria bacterium]|nr:DUF285 domain-containing protein [Candidatus Saccharibacteria bacterium]